MNRTELQQLAEDRIEDARVLLDHQRWPAAYYLAGYAVECGLKSCILAYVDRTGAIFKDKKLAERCWTHRLEDLVKLADLEPDLGIVMASNPDLASYWGVVKDWSETSRYGQKTELEARALHEAITHDPDGVFQWIQTRW